MANQESRVNKKSRFTRKTYSNHASRIKYAGIFLRKRENTYPHVVNGQQQTKSAIKRGQKKKGTLQSLPFAFHAFYSLKHKEEKSFRHVAMEAKKNRSRGNMAEKTKEVNMYDFPVHDCIQ